MHVTEWQVPQAQWLLWEAFQDSNFKPLLEKMMADGRIHDWGLYTNQLHSQNGPTHGLWFSAAEMSAVQAVLEAEAHLPASSLSDNLQVKHRDFLFRKVSEGGHAAHGAAGILWVHRTQSSAAKYGQSPAFWEKDLKLLLDGLVEQGVVISCGIEIEQSRTQSSGVFYVHCLLAAQAAVDKFFVALTAMQSKMSGAERDEFNAVPVIQDQERLGRVTSFGFTELSATE